ncbi:hypothetical protein [Streptomyces sp. NPDC058861]|uniref:hypothetical protein n=1 Tax=Streptomyces sp. NPDC058861 TaxID=3346653 RepID=UPI00367D38A5
MHITSAFDRQSRTPRPPPAAPPGRAPARTASVPAPAAAGARPAARPVPAGPARRTTPTTRRLAKSTAPGRQPTAGQASQMRQLCRQVQKIQAPMGAGEWCRKAYGR